MNRAANIGHLVSRQSYNSILAGSFFIVLGSMLFTVYEYGVSVPFLDEWDAEARWLYNLYESGELGVSELAAPHNGHRIVITRVTALVLYVFNGGWDPQLQMVVNAFLHALICAFLIEYISRTHRGRSIILPVIFTTVLFAIPLSWLSIIVAFQTQFYFMILFSVLSIRCWSLERYIPGYTYGLLAMLSMTSGAFVFLALPVMLIIESAREKDVLRKEYKHILLSLSIFLGFIFTLSNEPSAQAYYAQHLLGFVVTVVSAISWPFRISFVIGLIVYIPSITLLIRALFVENAPRFLLGLSIFIALQVLAMGYFRGGEGVYPPNRYWEVLIVGIWLNGMICIYLVSCSQKIIFSYLLFAWFVAVSIGIASVGYDSLTEGLPGRKEDSQTSLLLVTEYIESGNAQVFENKSVFEVSHPDASALARLLDEERVVSILPSILNGNSIDRLSIVKTTLFYASPLFFIAGIVLLGTSFRREWIN